VLVGKPEGKIQLGRPGHRWEAILKWTLKMWIGDVYLIDLAVSFYEGGNETSSATKCGNFFTGLGLVFC
jgi:hypothetical protein